ncbi:hypothetical protein Hanom_Chr00s000001g01594761 [Helianthus anomalus]
MTHLESNIYVFCHRLQLGMSSIPTDTGTENPKNGSWYGKYLVRFLTGMDWHLKLKNQYRNS